MKYLMMIHHGTALDSWDTLTEAERQEITDAWGEIRDTPGVTPGLGLQPPDTATTVRVEDGRTLVTDGPFVDTKEAMGGYLVFEADDLDAAIALAARIPSARAGGAIEVRPVAEW